VSQYNEIMEAKVRAQKADVQRGEEVAGWVRAVGASFARALNAPEGCFRIVPDDPATNPFDERWLVSNLNAALRPSRGSVAEFRRASTQPCSR